MKAKFEIESDYGFFKANNNEEPDRLKLYDSDGEYIEYIDICEFICSGSSELYFAASNSASEYVANKIMEALGNDGVDAIVFPDASFETLYDVYGREFVNRIGDCALVVKED